MITRANDILGVKYQPFPEEFEKFETADINNNGDVVFVISHYLTSLEKLRCDNITQQTDYPYSWLWLINNKMSSQETDKPTIK